MIVASGLRLRSLLVASSLLVCVTACGASTAAGGNAPELRLGYYANLTHAAALVGVKPGFLAEALSPQTSLKTNIFNAGPDAVEALLSDSIDATYVGPNPAINAF